MFILIKETVGSNQKKEGMNYRFTIFSIDQIQRPTNIFYLWRYGA